MIHRLITSGVVKFGLFKLSSGLESPFYVDLRGVFNDPELFHWVVEQYRSTLSKLSFDVIVGVATGGIPYASTLGYLMKKPFGYVRPEAKEYGLKKRVEGVDVSNKRVVVLDDVITTGKNVIAALNTVRAEGGVAVSVVVFLDREQCGAYAVRNMGVDVYSVFKMRELLNQLKPYIDQSHYVSAISYLERWDC